MDADTAADIGRAPDTSDSPGGQDATMSAREAAARAGVNERTVRRAIVSGQLLADQIAGVYRISPAALNTWLSVRQSGRGKGGTVRGMPQAQQQTSGAADMVPAAVFREERERSDALARELKDTAALAGILRGRLEAVEAERDRLLAITATSQEGVQDAKTGPQRDEIREMESDLMMPAWRRWWRRMMGA